MNPSQNPFVSLRTQENSHSLSPYEKRIYDLGNRYLSCFNDMTSIQSQALMINQKLTTMVPVFSRPLLPAFYSLPPLMNQNPPYFFGSPSNNNVFSPIPAEPNQLNVNMSGNSQPLRNFVPTALNQARQFPQITSGFAPSAPGPDFFPPPPFYENATFSFSPNLGENQLNANMRHIPHILPCHCPSCNYQLNHNRFGFNQTPPQISNPQPPHLIPSEKSSFSRVTKQRPTVRRTRNLAMELKKSPRSTPVQRDANFFVNDNSNQRFAPEGQRQSRRLSAKQEVVERQEDIVPCYDLSGAPLPFHPLLPPIERIDLKKWAQNPLAPVVPLLNPLERAGPSSASSDHHSQSYSVPDSDDNNEGDEVEWRRLLNL